MHTLSEHLELATIGVDAISNVAETRDPARWELCRSVCAELNEWRPREFPGVPSILKSQTTVSLIDHMPNDNVLGSAFAVFRAQVTEVEAANSKRLEMLATVKHTLAALRDVVPNPDPIERMLSSLNYFIAGAWRIEIPAEKLHVRLWCQRVTRRYDLLSREWREL